MIFCYSFLLNYNLLNYDFRDFWHNYPSPLVHSSDPLSPRDSFFYCQNTLSLLPMLSWTCLSVIFNSSNFMSSSAVHLSKVGGWMSFSHYLCFHFDIFFFSYFMMMMCCHANYLLCSRHLAALHSHKRERAQEKLLPFNTTQTKTQSRSLTQTQ